MGCSMSFLKLDEFTVPGYGLTVSISAALKDEDASGETSGTARATKGKKGKKLEVRCSLQYRYADQLRELLRYAEATEKGDAKVYTLTNDTANTAGMRQATFRGTIRADQDETLRKWDISFTLVEHLSVPEMAEAREAKKDVTTQTNEGAGWDDTSAAENNAGTVEKMLKYLNEKIGDEESA